MTAESRLPDVRQASQPAVQGHRGHSQRRQLMTVAGSGPRFEAVCHTAAGQHGVLTGCDQGQAEAQDAVPAARLACVACGGEWMPGSPALH